MLYASSMAQRDAWLMLLNALLKSISTRRNRFLRRCASFVIPYSLHPLMSVLLFWRKPPCACDSMCAFSIISVRRSLTIYAITWLVQLSNTTGLQWDAMSAFGPPLWRRASLPVISFSVTLVSGLPSARISLSHSLITRSCSGGIVLISSACILSGPGAFPILR